MKEQILKILNDALPQIDFTSSTRLVDDGILDSLSIITLVSELSMEFDVDFDLEQLEPQNLNSLDAIVETVKQLMGQAE